MARIRLPNAIRATAFCRVRLTTAVAFTVPLVLVLGGCATNAPTEDPRADWLVGERDTRDWFCEPAEDGGWDCVQDPQRVANPRPVRLPKPLFAEPGAAGQGQPPPLPSRVAPPPTAAAPPRIEPDGPAAIPLYQRLAFQPDRPTDIADLPGSYYAIQLIAMSSQEDLEGFIADNNLPVMSGAVVERDGERFYALLAGIYTDRDTAERAARSLPEELAAHTPWVRSLASLQAAMARAEQLPES